MADNEILFRIKVVDEGGKPLPTTIQPAMEASAGAEDVLIVSENEILALS